MASLLAVGSGLVSSVEQALQGAGITIGGVALTEMEVPEKLTWGGQQQLAVHRLLGGQRVVDAMGADDRTLDWSGLMRGSSAVSRARQLDAMRQSGATQVITRADFVYTVVVQSFEADYTRQGYRIPYRISCLVIPQPRSPTKPGLFDSVVHDLAAAVGLDGLASTAQQAITYAQAALPVVGVITGGGSTFLNLSTAVGQASGVVDGLASLSDSQVGGLATAASAIGKVIPGGDALTAVSSLQSAATSTQSLAVTTQAASFIGRTVANLKAALP